MKVIDVHVWSTKVLWNNLQQINIDPGRVHWYLKIGKKSKPEPSLRWISHDIFNSKSRKINIERSQGYIAYLSPICLHHVTIAELKTECLQASPKHLREEKLEAQTIHYSISQIGLKINELNQDSY